MRKLFIIFFIFFSFLRSSFAEVYFSQDCKKNILNLIENSKKEIYIAVYSIDDPDIVSAIFNFIDRGGKVKVITDKVQAAGRQSRSPDIYNKIHDNLKINSKRFKIMHDKFAIFDFEKAINGSFNWTYAAANKNAEDCRISSNKNEIQAFYAKFIDMWDSFSNKETEYFFKKLALKKEIKKQLEKEEKSGNLDNLIEKKINKNDEKNIRKCIIICQKKCIHNDIIKNKTNKENLKNRKNIQKKEIIEHDTLSKDSKSLNSCKAKCKNKCSKKILIKKLLNNKIKKTSNEEDYNYNNEKSTNSNNEKNEDTNIYNGVKLEENNIAEEEDKKITKYNKQQKNNNKYYKKKKRKHKENKQLYHPAIDLNNL